MTLASNSKIAVVGSGSMVGSRFCQLWQDSQQLVSADLNSQPYIDLTKPDSITEFFANSQAQTAILFSAFTDVDLAEKQRNDKSGLCWKLNVEGVREVAQNCHEKNIKLIFISTDFVYDGQSGPYAEDDPVGPDMDRVSWYGISKIEAEKIVRELDSSIILRISYPYRANFEAKADFYKKILKLYKENQLYPMFDDQIMTPTFIDDVAPAIRLLLETKQSGIYHLASPVTSNPHEIAKYLIKTVGGNPDILQKASLAEFLQSDDKTPRPVKGGLKVSKISKLGLTPTAWDVGIEIIKEQSGGKLI